MVDIKIAVIFVTFYQKTEF